jgi:hypothetical protein
MLFGIYNDLGTPTGAYLFIEASNSTPANCLGFQFAVSGTNEILLHSSGAVNDGNWHHACGVLDFTPGTSTLYLDGVSVATGTPAGGTAVSLVGLGINVAWTTAAFNVGNPYAGDIADCAFWGAGLTALEVAALAQGARPHHLRLLELLGWWPLDGLETPEPDATSGNYSGISGNTGIPIPNNMTVNGTVTQVVGPPISTFTRMRPLWQDVPPPPPPPPPTIPVIVSYNVM